MLEENIFNAEEILERITKWVRIESPTHHTAGVNAMMDVAESELKEMGASTERLPGLDGFGDVVTGRFADDKGRNSGGILVLSHLDTVHEVGSVDGVLEVRRDGDKVYGPGIFDMKGGAQLGLSAMRALQKAGVSPKLPVTFMFTPDEEVGTPSARERIETEAKANKYVLVLEPLRTWGDVVVGRHAIQRFFVRTYGSPSHAGSTKAQGRSAITKMAELVGRIDSMTDYDRGTTYSVGTIHGGTFVNVVAIACEAQVLCVAPSNELLDEICERMAGLEGEEDGVRIEVEKTLTRPVAPPHEKTMQLYETAKGLADDLGITFGHCLSGGGSDGNFTGALGIATLDGLGVAGGGAHTFEEHLLVSSLVPRCRMLAGLLEHLE
ncbi:MAG: M20/M25/M40 family metallo-hydrolase [Hyphomicrobiaceae bacterium]|nr:M20/M25/M40 family metallo-hydrolase [Hyphomicrobiaceae bacterium]